MKFKWEKPELVDLDTLVAYGNDADLVCSPVGSAAAALPGPCICLPTGGDVPPPPPPR